jgi:hypothetical protein
VITLPSLEGAVEIVEVAAEVTAQIGVKRPPRSSTATN